MKNGNDFNDLFPPLQTPHEGCVHTHLWTVCLFQISPTVNIFWLGFFSLQSRFTNSLILPVSVPLLLGK